MIEVAFALSFEHEMGEKSAKFHFTRERVAAVVSGCAVRLLQSMPNLLFFSEMVHEGSVHVAVPGIPHPIIAGTKSQFAEKSRQMALEGSCFLHWLVVCFSSFCAKAVLL